jgi:hypothetical protein
MLLVFECQRLLKGDLWCIHPVNKSLIGKHHGLFHPKQVFHAVFVCFVNQTCVRKISLLLFSLLRQNVTFVCMLSLDFSWSGKGEPLLGTGISLHFWHFAHFFCKLFNLDNQPDIALP